MLNSSILSSVSFGLVFAILSIDLNSRLSVAIVEFVQCVQTICEAAELLTWSEWIDNLVIQNNSSYSELCDLTGFSEKPLVRSLQWKALKIEFQTASLVRSPISKTFELSSLIWIRVLVFRLFRCSTNNWPEIERRKFYLTIKHFLALKRWLWIWKPFILGGQEALSSRSGKRERV